MTVHATDEWLKKLSTSLNQQASSTSQEKHKIHLSAICEPLSSFFPEVTPGNIQDHLLRHGLFSPVTSATFINEWLNKDYYSTVNNLYQRCKRAWEGPSTNIFILPSNEDIRELKAWFNSNAGLSYPDKLFLFLSSTASTKEIAALFIHEYSHTCRLHHFPKEEFNYTLLDAVILEGIAEWLVRKKIGKSYGNKRIEYLSDEALSELWERWIKPHQKIKRMNYKHDLLMYGSKGIPKNIGYIIGYNIVLRYMEKNKKSPRALLRVENEEFISDADLA
ncbi:DUF2268 domain-containing protein [Gracilibacillus kekensis]|uniref:Uncharacterized protein YjaZ n=1 Tax=Gracilibacillus kekensis TaxID=1027249 RepID=A0A1M7L1T8_9BACI|nr:DUF2268 domain-containing putative Zn-dependent protease [Gracilibacillus kekensis]SHM71305.1 Uncharacterized protein YjaZ [Gracilibacillus kekensis]